MNKATQTSQNDFFTNAIATPANSTLEVEIATASRVGVDGATIDSASINTTGELMLSMNDGRKITAGTVGGRFNVKGMAGCQTVPVTSTDPQIYLASQKGTYGYFRDINGQPIHIEKENTIGFLYCSGNNNVWEYSELAVEMNDYRKKADLTYLSSKAPVFSNYPPKVDAVPGLYDEATGQFHLAEGQTNVTSQTEVFGQIVYADCSHIMMGFNLSYAIYLEVETGKCLCMNVITGETHYHDEPFAPYGITKKYVRVNTYNPDAEIIDVEESDNGVDYTLYSRVNRGAWHGLYITYRTIGFYQPGSNDSKILSIGQSNRLMLEDVLVIPEEKQAATIEVLVPSNNFTGVARRKITTPGKKFADKRIMLYGDSISDDYGIPAGTYAGFIRQKFGTDKVIQYGQSGQTLGSMTEDKSDSLSSDQMIADITACVPDLLILQGGVGDYWKMLPLGDYYGSVENPEYTKTTTGGLRYLLHHLTKNLPRESKLLFITPPPGIYNGVGDMELNANGHRMDEYVRRFRDICAEYHVPVCDFWATAAWPVYHEAISPKYTIDGVHLSKAGYDRMTDLLIAEANLHC